MLFGMPLVGGVYTAWAGSGVVGLFVRGIIAGHLSAAADAADGRDAAGDRPLGGDDAAGRLVARILLRRQHRRRGASAACSPVSICCACTTSAVATYVAVALNVAGRRVGSLLADTRRRRRTSARAAAGIDVSRRPAPWAVYVAIGAVRA